MEHAAVCVYDFALLARTDAMSWDPENVFERLIPRREAALKRNLLHASTLQVFARRHCDDAGTLVVWRPANARAQSVFDIAVGAKDTALYSIHVRPMFDLSAHVAVSLRRFLDEYSAAHAQHAVDLSRLRMAPLMTELLRAHVREYVGSDVPLIGNASPEGQPQQQQRGAAAAADGDNSTAAADSLSNRKGSVLAELRRHHHHHHHHHHDRGSSDGGSHRTDDAFAPSSEGISISSSIARAMTGQTQPIRFGPPVEILSCMPLSVHLQPYGRHAFFPELLERRRQLEQAQHVDPDAWRSVVLPPKLVAAVLRFFVVVLSIPARVVLPRLAEVLPGAVQMHYESSGEQQPPSQRRVAPKQHTLVAGNNNKFPAAETLGPGIRYFQRINEAARSIVQRAHFLTSDALLMLHYTPHAAFGTKHESPLLLEARVCARANGLAIVEKIDLAASQEFMQVLGAMAKRFTHIYVCYEDTNSCGATLPSDIRHVLKSIACSKFTLLVDGTFNVGNPCAPPRSHWLNSARNAPGSGCADAYLIGAGAFLPTVIGRAAMVVYPATKTILDIDACLTDPLLPLLIDDAVVIHIELSKAMGAAELAQETAKAAHGLANEARVKLVSTDAEENIALAASKDPISNASFTRDHLSRASLPSVKTGIVCAPVPALQKLRAQALRYSRKVINQEAMVEAPIMKQLGTLGVSVCLASVNLRTTRPPPPPPPPQVMPPDGSLQQQVAAVPSLLSSVTVDATESNSELCAILTPHLQTIEQVPWDSVWRVFSGLGSAITHPERAPSLAPAEIISPRAVAQLKGEHGKAQEDAKKAKQKKQDEELVGLLREIMGENARDAELLRDDDPSGDSDPLGRDPYSYSSRLDNLLAYYDPPRAGSARSLLDGMIEAAQEDFFGFRYDPEDESADDSKSKKKQQQRSSSGFLSDFGSSCSSSSSRSVSRSRSGGLVPFGAAVRQTILRKDVLEAIQLGRLVLHYGPEPSTNAPVLIAQVLKAYCPQQFDKFPVFAEAYKNREEELLNSLVEKFVPPHRRGHFRARPMLLRAPSSVPEADLAVTRRMVHKCLLAHRPERVNETSSISHLLAPLVTLARSQTMRNPLSSGATTPAAAGDRGRSMASAARGNSDFDDMVSSRDPSRTTTSASASASASVDPEPQQQQQHHQSQAFGADFLREEDTDGTLVRRILEEEIGIVPRAVGVSIIPGQGGRTRLQGNNVVIAADGRPELPGGTTPAVQALIDQNFSDAGYAASASSRHPEFLSKMFRSPTAARDARQAQERAQSAALQSLVEHGGEREGSSSPMSASLAVNAANAVVSAHEAEQRGYSQIPGSVGRTLVPSMTDRVTRMYAQYEPAKQHNVGALMLKWRGREEILMHALISKYGPEPAYDAPIRTFQRRQHFADPALERPGHMVNVMRGYYEATQGPAARAILDDALAVAYPPEDVAMRAHRKLMEGLRKEMRDNGDDIDAL